MGIASRGHDASGDGTGEILRTIAETTQRRLLSLAPGPRFGHAVRAGLERYTVDAVAIAMADLSDAPRTWPSTTASEAEQRERAELGERDPRQPTERRVQAA